MTKDGQLLKFLNMMKEVQANIPLVDALTQMSRYAKFMKELLSSKRKIEELDLASLSEKVAQP